MKIDGKTIADSILDGIHTQVNTLKPQGVTPTLAVIQVGDDPGSTAYIKQKQKAVERIGANLILSRQTSSVSRQQLQTVIEKYNAAPTVHGIILQRPLPESLRAHTNALCGFIRTSKDVDGFLTNSPYPAPVAAAVFMILRFAFSQFDKLGKLVKFDQWIKKQGIVVIGRGETAGTPIAAALTKRRINPTVVHSQTPNPDAIIRAADIVISCVGKPNVVRRDNVKKGAVLISVGIWRDSEEKLHSDYEEAEIKDTASFYTPTPGGVGPINVACLMANLVQAANRLL